MLFHAKQLSFRGRRHAQQMERKTAKGISKNTSIACLPKIALERWFETLIKGFQNTKFFNWLAPNTFGKVAPHRNESHDLGNNLMLRYHWIEEPELVSAMPNALDYKKKTSHAYIYFLAARKRYKNTLSKAPLEWFYF